MGLSAGIVSASGQVVSATDILFVEDVGGGVSSRFVCRFLVGVGAGYVTVWPFGWVWVL